MRVFNSYKSGFSPWNGLTSEKRFDSIVDNKVGEAPRIGLEVSLDPAASQGLKRLSRTINTTADSQHVHPSFSEALRKQVQKVLFGGFPANDQNLCDLRDVFAQRLYVILRANEFGFSGGRNRQGWHQWNKLNGNFVRHPLNCRQGRVAKPVEVCC